MQIPNVKEECDFNLKALEYADQGYLFLYCTRCGNHTHVKAGKEASLPECVCGPTNWFYSKMAVQSLRDKQLA